MEHQWCVAGLIATAGCSEKPHPYVSRTKTDILLLLYPLYRSNDRQTQENPLVLNMCTFAKPGNPGPSPAGAAPVTACLPFVVVRTSVRDVSKRQLRDTGGVAHVRPPEGLVPRHGGVHLSVIVSVRSWTVSPARSG